MEKPKIISLIRIEGKLYNQDDLPAGTLAKIVEQVIKSAALKIGFEATAQKEKPPDGGEKRTSTMKRKYLVQYAAVMTGLFLDDFLILILQQWTVISNMRNIQMYIVIFVNNVHCYILNIFVK